MKPKVPMVEEEKIISTMAAEQESKQLAFGGS